LCAADLAPLRSGEHRAPVARALQHLRRRRRAVVAALLRIQAERGHR
jgi:single-stranded DNA-specific DHH superfamily exonuclease